MKPPVSDPYPMIRDAGIDGLLVTFGETLSEPANRAALAFREAVERAGFAGVEETSTSLVSTYLRFDPLRTRPETLRHMLEEELAGRDWRDAPLPEGRRFFRIPTVYGTDRAPQLAEAAQAAGMRPEEAIRSLSEARVRVTTIGFAPGQPYLGELPEDWNIPRQQKLTPTVPAGALAVAIRQFVLFSNKTPTGWRHVGQTGFRLFRPDTDTPFVLRPGDEVQFVAADRVPDMADDPDGGAVVEPIR